MIYINSYGSILFFTAQIFQSVRLVSVFSSDKNREFSGSVCRWFLILPHAAHIFSAEVVFGISESISPLLIFYSPQAQKNRRCVLCRTAGIPLLIFLIVLRENARDLLLGLHDLVVKALCRHAHRAVPENDQLL